MQIYERAELQNRETFLSHIACVEFAQTPKQGTCPRGDMPKRDIINSFTPSLHGHTEQPSSKIVIHSFGFCRNMQPFAKTINTSKMPPGSEDKACGGKSGCSYFFCPFAFFVRLGFWVEFGGGFLCVLAFISRLGFCAVFDADFFEIFDMPLRVLLLGILGKSSSHVFDVFLALWTLISLIL